MIGDLAKALGIRDDLFISTKTDIRGQVRGETGLQSAITRLKTDMIDVMLVHNLVNAGTEMPVMREWQQHGRLRYIGASISTHDQFDQMEAFMRDNEVQIVQFNYSLGDRKAAERLLPLAADRGIAVMVNVPFGGGRSSHFDVVGERRAARLGGRVRRDDVGPVLPQVHHLAPGGARARSPARAESSTSNDNFGAAFGRLPDAALRRRQEEFFDSLA